MTKKVKGDPLLLGLAMAREENNMFYYRHLRHFTALALNRIKWTGLPEHVDARYLETTLLKEGRAIFYNAGTKTNPIIMATRATPRGTRNLYEEYEEWDSVGSNGHYERVPKGEAIAVHDNQTRLPVYPIIVEGCAIIAELDQIARVNRRQQRQQVILEAPETAEVDLKALQQSMVEGSPYMVQIKSAYGEVTSKVLDLSVDYKHAEFNEDKLNQKNELLTILGIKNQPFDRSQYANYEEVTIANDEITRIREDMLSSRREAAKKINEKFGLDISVDWRTISYDLLDVHPTSTGSVEDQEEENE